MDALPWSYISLPSLGMTFVSNSPLLFVFILFVSDFFFNNDVSNADITKIKNVLSANFFFLIQKLKIKKRLKKGNCLVTIIFFSYKLKVKKTKKKKKKKDPQQRKIKKDITNKKI